MGERSSGTNFGKRILGRNTPLSPSEALGWKHGFAQMTAIPADMLVVCMVRNAPDWARSMHSKPWHTSPAMQRLAFSDFLRAPWDTSADRARYFDGAEELGFTGQPLQHDRHPLTGAPFADLFELRQVKLAGLLSYLNRDCNLAVLRMEEVIAAPEDTVDAVLQAFGLPDRTGPFRGIAKRLGSKFKAAVADRPETPKTMSEADMDYLRARVDQAQEAMLGYTY